jgi:phosphatidylglycerophosphate synthase
MDRRPLASRGWPAMHTLARTVAKAGITPNAVSVAGMVAGIGAGVLLACTSRVDPGSVGERAMFIVAGACVQFRLVCNLIDGMVAVEGGKRSAVGELYNEVPDRISDAAVLIGAGYAVTSSPTLGYAGALLAVFVAYVRAVGKGCGLASDYSGPMAKQQRMFVVTLACAMLGAGPLALREAAAGMVRSGVMSAALWIVIAGSVLTAARRLRRIAASLRERGI